MPEIGPTHPITYRAEIVGPIFALIHAGESAAVVASASMGKSRLVQFLLRHDVRRHYLGDAADATLLAWADCNRMAKISEWGLHELILTALVEAIGTRPGMEAVRQQLNQLRREAIVESNALLAQRHVELAVRMVCQEHGLRVCLLFDEFDESFSTLPVQALASLRALRDANKYWLTYVLFLRHHPAHLRDPEECEGFYELISRSILGLKPYTDEDARRILIQLQARRGHRLLNLSEEIVTELLRLSGGHPGLLGALVDGLTNSQPLGVGWQEWAQRLDNVQEELRKLWAGLRVDERQALNRLALSASTGFRERESLLLKGLIRQKDRQDFTFFTPLLRDFAATQPPNGGDLRVDVQSGAIYVNGKLCETLTAREFDLFKFLYEHTGEICEIDQIVAHLYPDYKKDKKSGVFNNTITALVGRVRKKIEPYPGPPQYLLNVKGRGYKLMTTPDASD
ncbi:MAG: winged helix-turn-helix domain-containing protein [Caldilineaceae bacterium]|nr:winged helix-turn-helix domain-containing protein [Caldilineaceae bacterium]MBP8122326.1 winged helix-turn-helix domain-containing protein [Caldilineaceae bacterium]MBP9072684.1 winged helix-turn-helix domain-containing protein [Caldilineaceae bacterium]